MASRDNFTQAVKRELERRVASVCSKPACGRITSGPHSDPAKSLSIGEAGHITSAAPGGPRYDPNLTPNQRRAASNGIWLCSVCHTIVDSDESPFSADELREWKVIAERRAREAIELARKRSGMPAFVTLLHRSMELIPDRALERSLPLLFRNVHEVTADLRAACAHSGKVDVAAAVETQVSARNQLWQHVESVPSAELAYYGIAHVPLAVHMGHLLGTRISAHFAERDRDGPGWRWLHETAGRTSPLLVERSGIPTGVSDVAMAVSVSYPITEEQIVASVGEMPIVKLGVAVPELDIVRDKPQVEAYSERFRGELERLARIQSIRRVHLFAATPLCLSFAIGRQIRRTVHPDVFAYNYHRTAAERPYSWRLLMTDDPQEAKKRASW